MDNSAFCKYSCVVFFLLNMGAIIVYFTVVSYRHLQSIIDTAFMNPLSIPVFSYIISCLGA